MYGSGQDAVNWAWRHNSLNQEDEGNYECNVITGCKVNVPITVDCVKNGCRLDRRLDKAILFYSGVFEIPPDLLGGTLATEVLTDLPWWEPPINRAVQDSASLAVSDNPVLQFVGNLNLTVYDWGERLKGSPGVGNQNYHIDTAREVEAYFQVTYGGNRSDLVNPGSSVPQVLLTLGSTDGNIRYAAAYLRYLADLRTKFQGSHIFGLMDDDKMIIYGAYRAGIQSYGGLRDFRSATKPGPLGMLMQPSLNNYRGYYPQWWWLSGQ